MPSTSSFLRGQHPYVLFLPYNRIYCVLLSAKMTQPTWCTVDLPHSCGNKVTKCFSQRHDNIMPQFCGEASAAFRVVQQQVAAFRTAVTQRWLCCTHKPMMHLPTTQLFKPTKTMMSQQVYAPYPQTMITGSLYGCQPHAPSRSHDENHGVLYRLKDSTFKPGVLSSLPCHATP